MQLNQVTVPTMDYASSIAFYRALGLALIVDSPPNYARFQCPARPDQGPPATFSISAHDHMSTSSDHPVCYFETQDMDQIVEHMRGLGYDILKEPADYSWRWREADIIDPSGNVIRLYWAGEDRRFPPWRVKQG